MRNYIHLYFSYSKKSLISRLEYKKDTFIAMMGFFLENAASILSIYFVISNIPSLNGWSIFELGFLYGFSMIPRGIDHLFADQLWLVAYRSVRNGEMDGYYLRPLPVLFQVIAETFQPDAFGELIVGTVMLITCGIVAEVSLNFSFVFLMIIAAIFGALIISSIKIIMASLAFVFKTSGPLLQIVYNFLDYVKYPISIFPAIIKNLLIFVIPFGLCISLPIEVVFFGTMNPYLLALTIFIVSILFLFLSIGIWSIFERKYESTGN